MAFDQKASMAVIEEAPIHHGIEVPSSSPPPPLNASDRPKSDDQDSPKQKNPLPHLDPHHQLSLDARQYTPILNPGQTDKNKGGFDSIGNRFGEVKELEEMFSKLNPLAEEFVPPSLTNPRHGSENGFSTNGFGLDPSLRFGDGGVNPSVGRQWKKGGFNQFRRRNNNGRTTMAQGKEATRRTVFVSDIDHQVTEEQLAALFINCGQVVDCRICGDPNSVLRFAFVEFTDEESALAALTLSGTMLGFYPVKVLPSKTQIVPVNPNLLPQNEDERDMCARTIYCTNIDSKVSHGEVKLFFESICGQVHRLRLLGDYNHPTRIAFVEFVMAESAIAALNCSGVILGSLPIRVSPSKTPVRPRSPRVLMH